MRKYGKRVPYMMNGGPLNGQILLLRYPGTLRLKMHNETGHYNENNEWVPEGYDGDPNTVSTKRM